MVGEVQNSIKRGLTVMICQLCLYSPSVLCFVSHHNQFAPLQVLSTQVFLAPSYFYISLSQQIQHMSPEVKISKDRDL